jgi:hypothetical protein
MTQVIGRHTRRKFHHVSHNDGADEVRRIFHQISMRSLRSLVTSEHLSRNTLLVGIEGIDTTWIDVVEVAIVSLPDA